MQDGFWSVFSETGDVVGYLICRAAENAARADGGQAAVSGPRARGTARAVKSAGASHTAGITPAAGGAVSSAAGENGG